MVRVQLKKPRKYKEYDPSIIIVRLQAIPDHSEGFKNTETGQF